MKLLVTGGAGYIGSVVAALLLEAGHEVVVLDDLSHRARGRGARRARRFVRGTLPRPAQEVLADGASTRCCTSRPSRWWASRWQSPALYWDHNLGGIARPAGRHAAAPGAADRLLLHRRGLRGAGAHADRRDRTRPGRPTRTARPSSPSTRRSPSTPGCTGSPRSACGTSTSPAPPAGRQRLGERPRPGDPPHPERPASRSPGDAGRACRSSATTTRPPDGTCVRDYIHVADLARAHLLALDACAPGEHRIYNLGSGSGFSNREVIEVCREVTGHEIPAVEVASAAPGRPGGARRLLRQDP